MLNHKNCTSYADAVALFSYGKAKNNQIKLSNNTYLMKDDDKYYVIFHGSKIITYLPNGDMILDHCGYKTKTTKDRFNFHMPKNFKLFQAKSLWYIVRNGKEDFSFEDALIIRVNDEVEPMGN